jgi:hypothetical protein
MGEQKKLLILCCHGVYHKGEFYADFPAEAEFYKEHIRESFNAIKERRYDVLIISGGCTKYPVEKSEARGYLDWADDLGLARTGLVILEECARSSLENLLFSMCRFYQYFGYFPKEVGSCTLFWKKEWQEQVIAPALCLPNLHVLAPNKEEEKLRKNWTRPYPYKESTKVANEHRDDPLEIRGAKKLQERDFWKKEHPYASINDDFGKLFKKLEEMKEEGNTNPDELKPFYPWRQKT